jgi:hypothetical protein
MVKNGLPGGECEDVRRVIQEEEASGKNASNVGDRSDSKGYTELDQHAELSSADNDTVSASVSMHDSVGARTAVLRGGPNVESNKGGVPQLAQRGGSKLAVTLGERPNSCANDPSAEDIVSGGTRRSVPAFASDILDIAARNESDPGPDHTHGLDGRDENGRVGKDPSVFHLGPASGPGGLQVRFDSPSPAAISQQSGKDPTIRIEVHGPRTPGRQGGAATDEYLQSAERPAYGEEGATNHHVEAQRSRFVRPQLKEGSRGNSSNLSGRRDHIGKGSGSHPQAFGSSDNVLIDNHKVHDVSGEQAKLTPSKRSDSSDHAHESSNPNLAADDRFPTMIKRMLEGTHRGPIGRPPRVGRKNRNSSWLPHCPRVLPMFLDQLLDDLPPSISNRIRVLMALAEADPASGRVISYLPDADPATVAVMLREGVAEVLEDPSLAPNSWVFLVAEPDKMRYRIITWPILANDLEYQWSDLCQQADICTICKEVHRFEGASAYDLRCSFFQIPLQRKARRNFIFRAGGRLYQMCRWPMGFRPSAEVMQLILQGLAQLVHDRVPGLESHVHVDNVIFLGPLETLWLADASMREICKRYNVTLGDVQLPAQQGIKFHSAILNFTAKTVSFTAKAVDRLRTIGDTVRKNTLHESTIYSLREPWIDEEGVERMSILKTLSTLTYYSRMLFSSTNFKNGCSANFFGPMQLLRAAGRELMQGRENIRVTREVQLRIAMWASALLRHKTFQPFPRHRPDPNLLLYTDASTTGGGYVLQKGEVIIAATGWLWKIPAAPAQIAQAEMRAATLAFQGASKIAPHIRNMPAIHLIMDSNVCLGALAKGYSPSASINKQVAQFYKLVRDGIVQLSYINTNENPADPWSRLLSGMSTECKWE